MPHQKLMGIFFLFFETHKAMYVNQKHHDTQFKTETFKRKGNEKILEAVG